MGEPGYGVAVANDATYGHDITRDGRTTTVRLSLLRAPLFPDPEADQGEHRFRVALRAGATIADVVFEAGYHDQPHLTRALRALLGYTPGEVARGDMFLDL